jgi:hypothetical protein
MANDELTPQVMGRIGDLLAGVEGAAAPGDLSRAWKIVKWLNALSFSSWEAESIRGHRRT